jgi:hypothetical protein
MRITPNGSEVIDASGRQRSGRDLLDVREILSHLPDDDIDRPPPVKTKIGHVHLHVGDIADGQRFYRDTLGFADSMSWARWPTSMPTDASSTASPSTPGRGPAPLSRPPEPPACGISRSASTPPNDSTTPWRASTARRRIPTGLLVSELPRRPDLELALAICLALLDREPAVYPRAAARWGSRFALESNLPLVDAQLAFAALAVIPGDGGRAGAEALIDLADRYGLRRVDQLLSEWIERRGLAN